MRGVFGATDVVSARPVAPGRDVRVRLRAAAPDDDAFLRDLWLEARPELRMLPPELVALQVRAQRDHYARTHPVSLDEVVEHEGEAVGRCWTAETQDGLHLLDLAVREELRGRGLGRAVLGILADRAGVRRVPLHLAVWAANAPARHLYRAVGFEERGVSGGHVLMRLAPGARS